jgi:hypothetical protein
MRNEAAKIRSRIKWTEEGGKSTCYFFYLEKKCGQDKLWNRIKTSEGHYKYDIDSIINEVKFYSKLFTSEGWDETCGRNLTQHLQGKLTTKEKGELDHDVDSNEIVKVLKVLISNKSDEDGIISEFYQLFWEPMKDEFILLVCEIFKEKQLSKSQNRGVLTLLFKYGERENIRNWRPLLNTDYKIIAKILAESLITVLPNLIHSDQKGFVKDRNISEANCLIQDIIDYIDQEDEKLF